MPNEIVPYESKPIVERRSISALAKVSRLIVERPGLTNAPGEVARTILIGRMLAGASESDLLLSALLCLPNEDALIALLGEPAGPAFKTHLEGRKVRYDADDPDMVARFLDWRLQHPDATVFASFDPSCGRALLKTISMLQDPFGVPVDVIFLGARNEGRPGLLVQMEALTRVIRARVSGLSMTSSSELEIPVIPAIIADLYQTNSDTLRGLLLGMPDGSGALFASELNRFSRNLEAELAQ